MVGASRFLRQLNDGLPDRLGKPAGFFQIRLGGFAPQQVGIWGVGQATRNGAVQAVVDPEIAFGGAFAGHEGVIGGIDITGDEFGAIGVCPGDQHRGHVENIGRQPGGHQRLDELGGRNQHLATQVAALLLRGQLVLEVDTRRSGFNHGLHEFERVQRTAEPGLGVGNDRSKPVRSIPVLFRVFDLVGAHESLIDTPDQLGNAVGWIEALIGVRLPRLVGVGGHLPAAHVNRLQSGPDLLHCLIAGERPERGNKVLSSEKVPQPAGTDAGERVLDGNRVAEQFHLLGRVGAVDAGPAVGTVAEFQHGLRQYACRSHRHFLS